MYINSHHLLTNCIVCIFFIRVQYSEMDMRHMESFSAPSIMLKQDNLISVKHIHSPSRVLCLSITVQTVFLLTYFGCIYNNDI